jgi:hypothetical protein
VPSAKGSHKQRFSRDGKGRNNHYYVSETAHPAINKKSLQILVVLLNGMQATKFKWSQPIWVVQYRLKGQTIADESGPFRQRHNPGLFGRAR